MTEVVKQCEEVMTESLREETAVEYLYFAQEYGLELLYSKAFDVIINMPLERTKSNEYFALLHNDNKVELLSSRTFKLEKKLDSIDHCYSGYTGKSRVKGVACSIHATQIDDCKSCSINVKNAIKEIIHS